MKIERNIVEQLKRLFAKDKKMSQRMELSLQRTAKDNPDRKTNPVRSLNDLYIWLERFLTVMPWEGLGTHPTPDAVQQNVFRRIDQSIGYFYYLFGDLQFEPEIAGWIKEYQNIWAAHLNSSESWNDKYYNLLKSDPLFELDTDKYESPTHWRCWNDFFSRRLAPLQTPPAVAEGVCYPWIVIDENNNLPKSQAIKTADVFNVKTLLGNSPYNETFANGRFMHITLDMYNYHRFHSPVDGEIVDIREIDGMLCDGGNIIWDASQNRYRYEYDDNLGYQMIEKRAVIVIRTQQSNLVAIIPVGVAQVGSIVINKDIYIGTQVCKGQEIGHFLCGGSDVIVMINKKYRESIKSIILSQKLFL